VAGSFNRKNNNAYLIFSKIINLLSCLCLFIDISTTQRIRSVAGFDVISCEMVMCVYYKIRNCEKPPLSVRIN